MFVSPRALALFALVTTWLIGCSGGSEGETARCSVNQQNSCPCTDGRLGVQVCQAGEFSPCSCPAGSTPIDPTPGTGGSGQAGTTTAEPSDEPVDIELFCHDTHRVFSRIADRCCSTDEKTKALVLKHSEIDREREEFCVALLTKSQALGRITFDRAKVTACRSAQQQAVDGATCGQLFDETFTSHVPATPCLDAVEGQKRSGEPCLRDHECVAGMTCVGFSIYNEGTCRIPGSGAACGFESNEASDYIAYKGTYPLFGHHPACAEGYFCDTFTGLCSPQELVGGSCNRSASGNPRECADGLFCLDGGVTGQCAKTPAGTKGDVCSNASACFRDEFCAAMAPCQTGLFCDVDSSYKLPPTCQPRKPTGTSCTGTSSQECQGDCVPAAGGTKRCVDLCSGG